MAVLNSAYFQEKLYMKFSQKLYGTDATNYIYPYFFLNFLEGFVRDHGQIYSCDMDVFPQNHSGIHLTYMPGYL